MALTLKVVTPERIVLEQTVASVTAMTENGEVTILPDHIPLTTALRAGEAWVRLPNGKVEYLAISTGFLQVRSGKEIVILADTAERLEELDLESIEKAKQEAERVLAQTSAMDNTAFAMAAAGMERELARYKVALRRRAGHGSRSPETEA